MLTDRDDLCIIKDDSNGFVNTFAMPLRFHDQGGLTMRDWNTDQRGRPFSDDIKRAVWGKASIIPGVDSNVVRQDPCGARIYRSEYGKRVEGGWEIDHIRPVGLGGGDELSNLQAMHWENNRAKVDNYPRYDCKVR